MSEAFRGADLVVQALQTAGVERVFTLSGNQVLPVFDACLDAGIELLHVRHEAAAVHMADAWGRLTQRPGVALLTAGPGLANAASALYVAQSAESPLVVLSGHAPLRRRHQGAFQEMPQAELAGHVAKASWCVENRAQLGHDVARAFRLAQAGRPGPVHVALPMDLLDASLESRAGTVPSPDDFYPTVGLLDVAAGKEILAAVTAAQRPLFLGGPALARGRGAELLDELTETTGVPAFGLESPRGVNDPHLGAIAEILAAADLVVLLGKPLDCMLGFGEPPAFSENCQWISIDPETRILEQTQIRLASADSESSRLRLAEIADSIPAVERLLQLAQGRSPAFDEWREAALTAVRKRPSACDTVQSPPDGPLHPADVCRAVQSVLETCEDTTFISDGGEFGQWAQACLSGDRRIINGPSGSIGGAIPFAMAARSAFPDSTIVALTGDGAFGFHIAEYETAVRCRLPFVAIVGNDACWNAEYQQQLQRYGPQRTVGCELTPCRYDRVVEAWGGHGEFVTRLDELPAALRRAFTSQLPACVNVSLARVAAPLLR